MNSIDRCEVCLDRSVLPEKTARYLVSVILMLSIIFPTVFPYIKIVLLFLVFILLIVVASANRLFISKDLYLLSLIYVIVGIAWSAYGAIVGNTGAIKVLTVMAFYPLVIPLISSLYRQEHNSVLYKIFFICAWIVSCFDLIYVATSYFYPDNLLKINIDLLYEDFAFVDISDDYIKFTIPNVSSIIFILPFFLSALFFDESIKVRFSILIVVFLLLAVALLSGRRGLLLPMVLGPVIAFMVTLSSARNKVNIKIGRRLRTYIIITLSIFIFIYISMKATGMDYYFDLINSIFDFTSNLSNLERVSQYEALMRGIADAPLFGHGAGANADYIRSAEMPWAYELFYLSIIFQYGILGFLLYASGIAFICWHLVSSIKKKGRSSFEFFYLSGFIAFMLATATNPYLAKFDYMWVLFIPYAIINLKLIYVENPVR